MNIFQYQDYRLWFRDWLAQQPKKGRGILSRLAEHLQIQGSFLSQVLAGQKALSVDQAYLLADYLGLSELELEYLIQLVLVEKAGNPRAKRHFQKKLDTILSQSQDLSKRLNKSTQIEARDQALFYSDWRYSATRLASSIAGLNDPHSIAKKLGLPTNQVRSILEFLLEKGLCVQESGQIGLGPKHIHLAKDSPWIRAHHFNWRRLAIEKIDLQNENNLHFTGPHSISVEDYQKVKELLIQVTKKVSEMITSSEAKKIACLNIDLFHVS